ncbi:MAG: hypothetical protein AAF614_27490 [Chloroflexota bacterium]
MFIIIWPMSSSFAQQEVDPSPTPFGFEDNWTQPRNLSRSGATTEPQMVRDSSGIIHMIWRDVVDGFVYTNVWREPIPVELPFGTRQFSPDLPDESPTPLFSPLLIAGHNEQIHAFWIEDDQAIYYSSVTSPKFADFESWSPRQQLAVSAQHLVAAVDANGRLHLAYLRQQQTLEQPAGIYYQQFDAEAAEWTEPIVQYASPYLRTLNREDINLHLLSIDNQRLFLVWDDNLLERIFLRRSPDNGQTWEDIVEMDSRAADDLPTAPGPSSLTLGLRGGELFATWQAGHEETGTCTQHVRRSPDKGRSWQEVTVLDLVPDCLENAQLAAADNNLVLIGDVAEATILLIWDGRRWSNPQDQELLTGFKNPETNQLIELGCRQTAVYDNRLVVIGCGQGEGGDIWLMERTLGNTANWFPAPTPTPIWQASQSITTLETAVTSLELVPDPNGAIHAFWTQSNDNRIWYARWSNELWSNATPILSLPNNHVEAVSVAVGNGRLFATWQAADAGIYFSQVLADRANAAAEWSEPQLLPAPRGAASNPKILLDQEANLFVAYTIPLNEQRGVYIIRSNDFGGTWSDTIQVFDGVAAQWEYVAQPELTYTLNNELHLLWTRRDGSGTVPLAIAYSRSNNVGATWWLPHEIISEETVVWHDIIGFDRRLLHRIWLVENNGRLVLQHAWSQDSGQTWSRATQVGGIGEKVEQAILTTDAANQPHLLTINEGVLQHWIWQDERWLPEAKISVADHDGIFGGSIEENGRLLALYETLLINEANDTERNLFFANREIVLPEILPTPLPNVTPTPAETAVVDTIPTPEPTATIVFPSEAPESASPLPGLPATNNSFVRLALGIIPAGLIVVVAFFIGIRAMRISSKG